MEGKTNFLLECAACLAETGGGWWEKEKLQKPTVNPVIHKVEMLLNCDISNTAELCSVSLDSSILIRLGVQQLGFIQLFLVIQMYLFQMSHKIEATDL